MLVINGVKKDCSFLSAFFIIVLLEVASSVSQLQEGDPCLIDGSVRGVCTSYHLCQSAHDVPRDDNSPVLCNSQDKQSLLVCCKERGRGERIYEPRRGSNKLQNEFIRPTERISNEDVFDDIETIYDVKRAFQDSNYGESGRTKHSIATPSRNPQYSSSHLYEPNNVQPTHVHQTKPESVHNQRPDHTNQQPPKNIYQSQQTSSEVNRKPQSGLSRKPAKEPSIRPSSEHDYQPQYSESSDSDSTPTRYVPQPDYHTKPLRPISGYDLQTGSYEQNKKPPSSNNQKPPPSYDTSRKPSTPYNQQQVSYQETNRPTTTYNSQSGSSSPKKPQYTQASIQKPSSSHSQSVNYEESHRPSPPSSSSSNIKPSSASDPQTNGDYNRPYYPQTSSHESQRPRPSNSKPSASKPSSYNPSTDSEEEYDRPYYPQPSSQESQRPPISKPVVAKPPSSYNSQTNSKDEYDRPQHPQSSSQESQRPPSSYNPRPTFFQPTDKPSRPSRPSTSRPPSGSGQKPSQPTQSASPWQEAPRPLVEDSNGYPDYAAPTTRRPQGSNANRPQVAKKTVSEMKCEEYSEVVTETIAGLPLTTDPKPVEINIQKCNFNAHQLIVGGQNTSVGEFPHMAAIGFLDRKRRTIGWNCGGSLISETFVLTAAHCTTSSYGAPSVVRLGEHNLKRGDDGAHPVDYLVKEVVRHPQYHPPARYHDIALLRLSRPVAFTTNIRPACLYSKPNFNTAKTVATGWGRIQYAEEQSDVLLKVVLSIIDNNRCNGMYKSEAKTEVLALGIINEQMCAGELTGGKDTCQGDSGGPIEVTSRGNQCVHHVIGVTSFGKRCGLPNAPGVYTRVSSYRTWIEGVVWPDLVRAHNGSN